MPDVDEQSDELSAMGSALIVIPEVASLVAYRRSLPAGTEKAEADELVMRRVHELIFGQLELPDGLLDKSIWRLLVKRLIPALRKELGTVTVRDVLAAVVEVLGVDRLITDYIDSAASGEASLPQSSKGMVVTVPEFKVGPVESAPIILAVITPLSDLDSLFAEVRDATFREFRKVPRHTAKTYRRMARMVELGRQGMDRRQITWQLLADEYPEIAAASDEEREANYKAEYKRMRARLRQLFKRLDDPDA